MSWVQNIPKNYGRDTILISGCIILGVKIPNRDKMFTRMIFLPLQNSRFHQECWREENKIRWNYWAKYFKTRQLEDK